MQQRNIVMEYAEALIMAIILALFIRAFVVQAYKIPSGSMLNTLYVGDFLLVNRFSYGTKIPFTNKEIFRLGDPQRGDIIVFKYPLDPSVDYIKRVVGVPGDVIEMRNKQLYRNGEKVDEPYIRHTDPRGRLPIRDDLPPRVVPQDHYFVMGDNRDDSEDSRFWGFVPRQNIQGKAWLVWLSWDYPKWTSVPDVRWSRIGTILR